LDSCNNNDIFYCYRFYSRLYSEYQQLLEIKQLQLTANSPNDDALLERVSNLFVAQELNSFLFLGGNIVVTKTDIWQPFKEGDRRYVHVYGYAFEGCFFENQ